ncbi:MAG: signal peptide peptidase SppA [Eubacterium sp.]|nr:signal peptide peptidase SppA [Eubacterium sp.]
MENDKDIYTAPESGQPQNGGQAPQQGQPGQQGQDPQTSWQQAQQQYHEQAQKSPQGGYYYQQMPQYQSPAFTVDSGKKMAGWKKALIVILIIIIVVGGISFLISRAFHNFMDEIGNMGFLPAEQPDSYYGDYDFDSDYIGVIYLDGTISDGDSGDGYSQSWIMNTVESLTEDAECKGILLSVNTPGGSAFATYDLYHALLDFKEKTGNPIYVYMDSQATSGGYYASMAADKIFAHEECWTGSIGVIIGTLYDYSGLLDKLGVKAYAYASGDMKEMGAGYKTPSDEEKAVFQSLIDDSYGRFVETVMAGRHMDEATVRKLADGRIYTAHQAKDNGLIDEIGTLDDALDAMEKDCGLEEVDVQDLSYEYTEDIFSMFMESAENGREASASDYEKLLSFIEESNKLEVLYMSPIRK